MVRKTLRERSHLVVRALLPELWVLEPLNPVGLRWIPRPTRCLKICPARLVLFPIQLWS